jgi:hypothetical protein
MTTPLAAALESMVDDFCTGGYHSPRDLEIAHRAAELALEDAERVVFEVASNHEDCPSLAFAHDVANAVRALLPTAGEFLRSELGGGTAKEIDRLRTQLAAARQSLIDRCDGLHFAGRLKEEKEWRRKIEEVFGP